MSTILKGFILQTHKAEALMLELMEKKDAQSYETMQDQLRKNVLQFIAAPIGDLETGDLLYLAKLVLRYRIRNSSGFMIRLAKESDRLDNQNNSHENS